MSNFIYSTLTAGQNYVVRAINDVGDVVKIRDIHINGGHGLTNRYGDILSGTVTEVSDEDLAALRQDFTFNLHVKNGWIIVDDTKKDPEKVISDLNQRDGGAPLDQADLDAMAEDGTLPEKVEVLTKEKRK